MASELGDRFRDNLARVRSIVSLYDRLGGPSVGESDLLRVAVVLLHASLEDLLRSLAEERLPLAEPSVLGKIPFPLPGDERSRKTTFTFEELAAHRGRTVDAVIAAGIAAHLERASYNNIGEVKAALDAIGLDKSLADPFAKDLSAMMIRRHLIVHRVDRNLAHGPGQHGATSISKAIVEAWERVVERFGAVLLSASAKGH